MKGRRETTKQRQTVSCSPLPHPQTLFSSSSDLLGGDGRWTDVEKAQDKEAFKAVNVKLPQSLPLQKKKRKKKMSAIEREICGEQKTQAV